MHESIVKSDGNRERPASPRIAPLLPSPEPETYQHACRQAARDVAKMVRRSASWTRRAREGAYAFSTGNQAAPVRTLAISHLHHLGEVQRAARRRLNVSAHGMTG
jgi:hypothetical protein